MAVKNKKSALIPVLGLDPSKPAEYIDERGTPNCKNISIDRTILRKRIGTSSLGSTAAERILAYRELYTSSTYNLLRIGLTKAESMNYGTGAWADRCPSTDSFVVDATNNKFDFDIGGGELTATIASSTYTMGAIQTDAGTLCKALYDAIVAAEAAGTYTVTHDGQYLTITRSAGTFSILWKTGTNGADGTDTHIGTLIGYSDAADDTGALTYIAGIVVLHPLTADTAVYRVDSALPMLSGARILTFTNFKDNIRKWTGGSANTADLGGSPPVAKFMVDYSGYLVLGHIASYPMRVQWSDTGEPETWTGGNSGAKDLTEDGQDITGMEIFGNYIAVHKETAIYIGYLVTVSAIFKFDRRNTGAGTVCFATIQNLPTGEQAFLARDGIRLFNGVSAPLIPSPIMDELKETMNPEEIHKCWSVLAKEKDEYWVGIAIGSDTEPSTVYKYNYRTGQCYKDYRSNITASGLYTAADQKTWSEQDGTWQEATGSWDNIDNLKLFPNIIFGDSAGVSSKRDNVNSDISTAITAFWDSKDFEPASPGQLGRWTRMQIWAKGSTIKIEYSVNRGENWNNITTLTLGSDYPTDDSPQYVYFDFVSSKARYRFSNTVTGETFYLKQFIVEYYVREMR